MSGTRTDTSVIAIVQEEDRLRAVELRKGPDGIQVAWAKTSPAGPIDWSSFAAECGLTMGSAPSAKVQARGRVVIGLGPMGVAFYRLRLPVVPDSEMEAMIRMQAETRLPLAADQMEIAWRIAEHGSEEVTVTLAATRRRQVQSLIDQVRPLAPNRLFLSSEALVKAWTDLFADPGQGDAVVIHVDGRTTQVCLVEAGMLSQMAMIDAGADDLVGARLGVPSRPALQTGGQTEIEEQFIQDIKAVLAGFPSSRQQEAWSVVVLSDGSPAPEYVADLLREAGLKAAVATPRPGAIRATFSQGQWYEYKTAIGLALMAMDPPQAGTLGLFSNLYRPPGQEEGRSSVLSTRTALGVAAAALVGVLAISYLTDLVLADRLKGLVKEHQVMALRAQRDTRQAVARYRPDVLALLKEVNSGPTEGIVLDSFLFKRGQAVQIVGQADQPEQLYKFEEALLKKDGIRDVKIDKSVPDTKTKKVKFTMTFQYKNFTQKGARF